MRELVDPQQRDDMNVILIERNETDADGRAVLFGRRARHVLQVLQLKEGDVLRVGILDGPLGTAEVVRIEKPETIELSCRLDRALPPRPRVDLLLALPRPKVMRRLWSPLAALGVGRIVLTAAWKVERNYFDTHILDPASYRPLLIEGLEQARDTRLPEVIVRRAFKPWVEDELDGLLPSGARLLADPGEPMRLRDVLPRSAERAALAVGPEGGWTDYEKDLLTAHGFLPFGMGSRALRTDAACVALLALAHDALGR